MMRKDSDDEPVSPTIRITAWVLISLVIAIIIGNIFAKTDIIARGTGRIVPLARVQLIQPQQSGKVIEIKVREGDVVTSGAVLVRLDATDAESEIARLSSEIEKQQVEKLLANAVLAAFNATDPASSEFMLSVQKEGQNVSTESASKRQKSSSLINATLQAIHDDIQQIDADLARVERSEAVQMSKIARNKSELLLIEQRFAAAKSLKKTGTISGTEMLDRERDLQKAQGEFAISENELLEVSASKISLQKQRDKAISAEKAGYEARLSTADFALSSLSGQLKLQRERLKNTILVAPISGRVENLAISTVGGFVEAGSRLLSIVPDDNLIEVEALFENRDIGFMKPSQIAYIKLDAFPAERFGFLKGKVTSIGADARQQTGSTSWVYAVRLSLDKDHMEIGTQSLYFSAGMTATVDVVTGKRRLISYFFEPIVQALQDGFGER